MLTVRYIALHAVTRCCICACVARMQPLMHGNMNIIYHAWAFSVVRLDDLGNARASSCGMGKGESHALFL